MSQDHQGSSGTDESTGSTETPEATSESSGLTRRRLVVTGATTWATVNLAGCDRIDDPGPQAGGGGGDGGGGSDGGDAGDGDDDEDTGSDDEDTGSGEPTTVPSGDGSGNTTVSTQTTTTDSPGNQTEGPTTTTACANIGRYAPGMEVGLHVNAYDTTSGESLGADRIDSVTVEFPDADFEPRELDWTGPHENYSEDGWGAKITTSEDTIPGTYRYEVTIERSHADAPETVTNQFEVV